MATQRDTYRIREFNRMYVVERLYEERWVELDKNGASSWGNPEIYHSHAEALEAVKWMKKGPVYHEVK